MPHVNSALTFILIVDCLFTKVLSKGKLPLIERKVNKKEIIECLLSSEQEHLHPHARTLVNLLRSRQPTDFLASLSLKAICDLFKEGQEEASLYE